MRCVVQRVKKASVRVENKIVGEIKSGLLAFIGIGNNDDETDINWMAEKILGLRIFEDKEGKMNRSVLDVGGELLLVSQFTLLGDCRKGKRPSFSNAAPSEKAKKIFDELVLQIAKRQINVQTGVFQADMDVELVNWGPVTILLDSKKIF